MKYKPTMTVEVIGRGIDWVYRPPDTEETLAFRKLYMVPEADLKANFVF
jgi:hypothetical protein